MIKTSLCAAPLLAALLTFSFASQAVARQTAAPFNDVGREVAAPSWSAACMTDHGPSRCDQPVWVYGTPAEVSRYRSAF